MQRPALSLGLGVLIIVGTAAAGVWSKGQGTAPTIDSTAMRNGRVQQFWPDGTIKSDVTYRDDAYDGEYRTWYASGRPFERRHYVDGREEGLQQSWTESGELYLNYQMARGRRFGLVNATPCTKVGDAGTAAAAGTPQQPVPDRRDPDAGSPGTLVDHQDPGALPYYDEPTFTPRWGPVRHRVAAFSLQTQTGASISDEALRGTPYVASFIYTQCAAVCPILVRQLSRVQAGISHGGARLVSFSVTPDADTPAALAAFGRERGIDPATWSLVTGDRRAIYLLARASFFADDTRAGIIAEDETAFLHTEKLVLVDGEGHLRGVYNGTQPHAVDQLIADLAHLTGR